MYVRNNSFASQKHLSSPDLKPLAKLIASLLALVVYGMSIYLVHVIFAFRDSPPVSFKFRQKLDLHRTINTTPAIYSSISLSIVYLGFGPKV